MIQSGILFVMVYPYPSMRSREHSGSKDAMMTNARLMQRVATNLANAALGEKRKANAMSSEERASRRNEAKRAKRAMMVLHPVNLHLLTWNH